MQISCLTRETQVYEVEEANLKIMSAYFAKDQACGTRHGVTFPLFHRADRDDVDGCVAAVLASDCAVWSQADPTPVACQALLIELDL